MLKYCENNIFPMTITERGDIARSIVDDYTTTSIQKFNPILIGALATVVYSVIKKLDTLFGLADYLYSVGTNSLLLYTTIFLVRFAVGAVLVLYLIPYLFHYTASNWSIKYMVKIDQKDLWFGVLSGSLFVITGILIAFLLGADTINIGILTSQPDVYVDPDVVGWMYFVLAIIPAIWEELMFRGLLLQKLLTQYSNSTSLLVSSGLFALYHFTQILYVPFGVVIGEVLLSFFFGLAWGWIVIHRHNVIPGIISHYMIDSLGAVIFYGYLEDVALSTILFLIIMILYPIVHYILIKPLLHFTQHF